MKPCHLLTGIAAAFAFTVAAQAQEKGQGGIDPVVFEQKVIRLTHVDAMDTAAMLQGFLSFGKVAADEHTNAIVLSAPRDEIAMAERVIAELDSPASEKTAESSTIIRLGESAPPDILDLVRTLVSRSTRAALDRQTGTLVLRGPAADIQEVRKLVENLPQPGARAKATPLTVTFYFILGLVGPEKLPDVAAPADASPIAADPRDKAALETLEKTVTLTVDNEPFDEVLKKLISPVGIDYVVNWDSLEALGMDREFPISVALRNPLPLRLALELVLEQAGEGHDPIWQLQEGILRIATREYLNQMVRVEVFAVDDLVRSLPRFSLDPAAAPRTEEGAPRPGDAPATAQIAPGAWDGPPQDPAERLMELIRATITPDDWSDNGGSIATLQFSDGMLVVKHHARGLRAVAELLDLLRARQVAFRTAVGQIEAPAALAPVLDSLTEFGFRQSVVLAPLRVAVGRDGKFELESSASPLDRLFGLEVGGKVHQIKGPNAEQSQGRLENSRFDVVRARADLDRRKAEHDRLQQLVRQGLAPQQELDEARRQLDVAAAQFKAAESAVGGGVVDIELDARMYAKALLPAGRTRTEPLFRLNSTVTAPLGDYVVLATSPGATEYGQAIALVVRVDAAD